LRKVHVTAHGGLEIQNQEKQQTSLRQQCGSCELQGRMSSHRWRHWTRGFVLNTHIKKRTHTLGRGTSRCRNGWHSRLGASQCEQRRTSTRDFIYLFKNKNKSYGTFESKHDSIWRARRVPVVALAAFALASLICASWKALKKVLLQTARARSEKDARDMTDHEC